MKSVINHATHQQKKSATKIRNLRRAIRGLERCVARLKNQNIKLLLEKKKAWRNQVGLHVSTPSNHAEDARPYAEMNIGPPAGGLKKTNTQPRGKP